MIEEWIRVRSFLLPAIELLGGTHNETDVLAMVLAGQLKLWTSPNAAALTQINQYPRLRETSVFAAGGNKEELIAMESDWVLYAADNKCNRLRIEGRKGWEKARPEFRFLSTTLVKDI